MQVPWQQGPRRRTPWSCRSAFRRVAHAVGCVLLGACLSGPARGQTSHWSGAAGVSSQLVDRGLAISPAVPMLQGAVSWTSRQGWLFGLSGGTELRSPGQWAEATAQIARSWRLSADSQVQASLLYYGYSRLAQSPGYRRAEMDLSWIYRDFLVLNVSALRLSGLGHSRVLAAADLDLRWPLAPRLSLAAGLGVTQFQHLYGYDAGRLGCYGYGNLGLAWNRGSWRLELDRVVTAGAPRQRPGTGGLSPWLATVAWSF